jgi:hypothetical protein
MVNLFSKSLAAFRYIHIEFFTFRDLIILLISLAVTGVKWIRGKAFVHAEFKLRVSSADGVLSAFSTLNE